MELQLFGVSQFREQLSASQIEAIKSWHGVGSRYIWEYYALAPDERQNVDDATKQFVKDFEDALDLAPLYRGRAYRGLSAGKWRDKHISYLRGLIDGASEIVFDAPTSTTHVESIGRGWMRCDRNNADDVNEGRHLAVLLICDCESARCLPSFVHSAGNESEVIIKRGTRFMRTSSRRLCEPDLLMEAYEVKLSEIVTNSDVH